MTKKTKEGRGVLIGVRLPPEDKILLDQALAHFAKAHPEIEIGPQAILRAALRVYVADLTTKKPSRRTA